MIHSNELPISPALLEQMMAEGGTRAFSVRPGPSPEARIVGVRWDLTNMASPLVTLVYDRPIEQPLLTLDAEAENEIKRLEQALCEIIALGTHENEGWRIASLALLRTDA
jgi:hypothetical protein